jgi:arylsulfatase A-like enzyme
MFFEHNGNRAVRVGNLKAVQLHKKSWELYDLSSDPTELVNLAVSQPDNLRRLQTSYWLWARENGVLEWPVKKE